MPIKEDLAEIGASLAVTGTIIGGAEAIVSAYKLIINEPAPNQLTIGIISLIVSLACGVPTVGLAIMAGRKQD